MKKTYVKWIFVALGFIFMIIQGIMSNSGFENMVFAYVATGLFVVAFLIHRKESDDKARAEGRPTHAEMKHEEKMLKLEREAAKAKVKASKASAKQAKGGSTLKKVLNMASNAGASMMPDMTTPYNTERCARCGAPVRPENIRIANGSRVCESCAREMLGRK